VTLQLNVLRVGCGFARTKSLRRTHAATQAVEWTKCLFGATRRASPSQSPSPHGFPIQTGRVAARQSSTASMPTHCVQWRAAPWDLRSANDHTARKMCACMSASGTHLGALLQRCALHMRMPSRRVCSICSRREQASRSSKMEGGASLFHQWGGSASI